MSGSGKLVKDGAGTLALGGTNNGFTGNLEIKEGALEITTVANTGVGGSITLGSGVGDDARSATFRAAGASAAIVVFAETRSFVLAGSGATFDVPDSASRVTIEGALTGGDTQTLTKTGAGRLILGGPAAKGYTGDTLVNAGSLYLTVADAIANSKNITVGVSEGEVEAELGASKSQTFSNITIHNDARLNMNGATGERNVTIADYGQVVFNGSISGIHNLTIGADASLTIDTTSVVANGDVVFGTRSVFNVGTENALDVKGGLTFTNLTTINLTKYVEGEYVVVKAAEIHRGTDSSPDFILKAANGEQIPSDLDVDKFIDATVSFVTENVSEFATIDKMVIRSTLVWNNLGDGNQHGHFLIETGELFTIGAAGSSGDAILADRNLSVPGFDNWDGKTLTKRGAGTLALNSKNTYSGGTKVEAGTISLGNAEGAGTGTITLGFNVADPASLATKLEINIAEAVEFANEVTGCGELIKKNIGRISLTAEHTYTGATRIESGILAIEGSGSIKESSGLIIESSGIFDIGGADGTVVLKTLEGVGGVTLGGKTLQVGNAYTPLGAKEFAGQFSGSGIVDVAADYGTFTLSGASSHSGGTEFSGLGGDLVLKNNKAVGNGVFTHEAAGVLTLANGLTLSNNIVIKGEDDGDTRKFRVEASETATLTGTLTNDGDGSVFSKQGDGKLTLNNAAALTNFSGVVEIDEGTLEVKTGVIKNTLYGDGDLLVTFTNDNTVLSFGAGVNDEGRFTGTFELPRGKVSLASENNRRALSPASLRLGKNTITEAGSVLDITHSASLAGTLDVNGGVLVFSADPISPATVLSVAKLDVSGGGTIRITGLDTYIDTSAVDISQNIYDYWTDSDQTLHLQRIVAAGVVVGSATILQWEPSATGGNSRQTRDIDNGNGVATFDYLGYVDDTTPEGQGIWLGYGLAEIETAKSAVTSLDATTAGTPKLIAKLTGQGGFRFSGASGREVEIGNAASDYLEGTTVSGITAKLLSAKAFGETASLSLENGAKVLTNGHALSLTSLSTESGTEIVVDVSLTAQSGNVKGTLSGAGSFAKTGTNPIAFESVNTYTGTTTVSGGKLVLNKTGSIADSAGLTLEAGTRFEINALTTGGATVKTLDGAVDTYVYLASKTLQIGTDAASADGSGTFAGRITGGDTGALVKTGSGTLVLSGNNSYAGGTRFDAGSITVRDNAALGTGALVHASDDAVGLTLADGIVLPNDVEISLGSAARAITVGAGETATMAGRFTATGALPADSIAKRGAGTLVFQRADALAGTGVLAIDIEQGALAVSVADFKNELRGTGTLRVTVASTQANPSGSFNFSASTGSAFTGTFDLASGSFVLEDANAAAVANATLRLTGSGVARVTEAGAAVSALEFNGGSLAFDTEVFTAEGVLRTVGLDAVNGGSLQIAFNKAVNVPQANAQSATNASLFDFYQDGTRATSQLVAATGTIAQGTALTLRDSTGAVVGNSLLARELQDANGVRIGEARFNHTVFIQDTGDASDSGIYVTSLLRQINVDAGRTLALDATGVLLPRLNARISGTGAIALTGVSSQEIFIGNADSDYTGATNLSSARFIFSTNNAFGKTSALTLASGARVSMDGHTQSVGALNATDSAVRISLGSASTTGVLVASSGDYAGVITGLGAIEKTGSGVLTLSGENDYTGGTLVSGGRLRVTGTLGAGPGDGDYAGTITLSGGSIEMAQEHPQVLSGLISGTGTLIKTGAGTLTVVHTNFHGGTTVLGGTLAIASDTALGTGANTISGATLELTGISGTTFAKAWTLGPDGATLRNDAAAIFSGTLSGTGHFEKRGTGILYFTGANSHTGGTTFSSGTVAITSDAPLGAGTNTLNGASLELIGASYNASWQIADSGGSIVNEAYVVFNGDITGAGALYKRGGGLLEINGVIAAPIIVRDGSIGGTGLLNMPVFAAGSSLSPGTAGTIGVLKLGAAGTTLALDGVTLRIDLEGDHDSDRVEVLGSVSFGTQVQNTLDLSIAGSDALWWNDGRYTLLTAAESLTTGNLNETIFKYKGVLVDSKNSRVRAVLSLGEDRLSLVLHSYSESSAELYWDGGRENTRWGSSDTSSTNWKENSGSGRRFVNGDIVRFASTGGESLTVTVENFGEGVIVGGMTIDANGSYVFGGGKIAGVATATSGYDFTPDGKLNVEEGANVRFNNEIDFIGINVSGTAVFAKDVSSENALVVTESGTASFSGTSYIGAARIENEGKVILDRSADTSAGSYLGTISGTGDVEKTGTGVFALSGVNDYTGTTTVSEGTLAIASDAATGTGEGILNGGALRLDGASYEKSWTLGSAGGTLSTEQETVLFTGTLSGEGGLAKTGAGKIVLSADNNYTGATNVGVGVLEITGTLGVQTADGTTTYAGNVAVEGGAALVLNQSASQEFSGTLSGAGQVAKTGAGTFALTDASVSHTIGALYAGAGVTGVAGSLTAALIEVETGATFDAAHVNVSGTGITNRGTFNTDILSASGYVENTGTLTVSENVSLASGTILENKDNATLQVAGTLDGGEVVNDGTLRARSISLTEGSISNTGSIVGTTISAAYGITNDGGAIQAADGSVTTAGTLENNNGATLATTALSATGGIFNEGSTITTTTATAAGSGISNDAGEFVATGAVTGDVGNTNGGLFRAGNLVGSLYNAQTSTAIVGEVRGNVENSGRMAAAGNINGEVVNNNGAVLDFGGTVIPEAHQAFAATPQRIELAGKLLNDGVVNLSGTGTRIVAAASLDNLTPATVGNYVVDLDFANPGASDHFELPENALVSGRHLFTVASIANGSAARGNSRVALIDGGRFDTDTRVALSAPVNAGAYLFDIIDQNAAILGPVGYSATAQTAVNTHGLLSTGWIAQIENIGKRFEEFRVGSATPTNNAPAPETNAFWTRAYGSQLDASLDLTGIGDARLRIYGGDVGYDKAFTLADSETLVLGAFVGYQTLRLNQTSGFGGKSDGESAGAGAYAAWEKHGWFATSIFKAAYSTTEYNTTAGGGEFNHYTLGFTLELGKRFDLGAAWFVESAAQFDYAHIFSETYATADGLRIQSSDSDILRFSENIRLGKTFDTKRGKVQPSVNLGVEYQDTLGGALRLSDARFTPTADGLRAIVGTGVSWQFTASQQIQLNYEASFGEKYNRPYSINASYHVRF
ncbi:MAG: autotransporter-associated beta strand repeat-containing protein [Puniceicoccales bacterium]|nr:autotransporter-associated beta strand repeat-containing protein [Puniceicoccales bacterium]